MVYGIRSDVTLCRSVDDTFYFLSDASNLEAITRPELRFSIKTPPPIEIRQGAIVEITSPASTTSAHCPRAFP